MLTSIIVYDMHDFFSTVGALFAMVCSSEDYFVFKHALYNMACIAEALLDLVYSIALNFFI
jgi:hypothetical protein